MSQPFYHLRPNKYVDRNLFINCLSGLSSVINYNNYRYIGFGSYYFDDFKQIHDQLNIKSMISLEADPLVYKRAKYNRPYRCIKILNQTSTDFISGENWGSKNSIIWLDYTAPDQLTSQFNDIAALSNIVKKNDIIKVTFNANAASLGNPAKDQDLMEYRFNKLKERIGTYMPLDLKPEEITFKKYPLVILRCLKKLLEGQFVETEYDPRFIMPLFSTVYKDGQMMVTFTGIVLENHNQESKLRKALRGLDYINFEWDRPAVISIPELTVKEMIEMNKLLPSKKTPEKLLKKLEFVFNAEELEEEMNSYASYYKHYPNFHSVSF